MGRPKNRHRPTPRNKPRGPNKKPKLKSSSGRDIRHRDQFKRLPPVQKELKAEKAQVESDSESIEEEDPYQSLLCSLSQGASKAKVSVESEEDSTDESEMSQDEVVSDNDSSDESMMSETKVASDDESEQLGPEMEDDGESDDNHLRKTSSMKNLKNDTDESESEIESDSEVGKHLIDVNLDVSGSEVNKTSSGKDPFITHIHPDLSEEAVALLTDSKVTLKSHQLSWKRLGHINITIPVIPSEPPDKTKCKLLDEPKDYAQSATVPKCIDPSKLDQYHIKTQLLPKVAAANSKFCEASSDGLLTPLQTELFSIFNNYHNVYFPERTLAVGEEVRFAYCLHIANHVLKTRSACIHHNARLSKKDKEIVPDEFRDQGLVRPKALVIVPFRESGKRVIEMLIALLAESDRGGSVMNRKRFDDEFSGGELIMPKKNARPEDYEAMFAGNTDDTFRLGLTITKKCVKLYADFYSSDIIVASPLGLRTIIGAEGEPDRDYDFLASIEILVIDQMDVCFMQNWEHVLHILDHIHLQPRESHGTDFARVRSWAANGLARFYRQTILLSATALPPFSALFAKRCHNYAGAARIVNPVTTGSISKVVVQLPQLFQRIDAPSVSDSLDARFVHFTKKVLPQYSDTIMTHTMIYVPSYFDYVRIRNHLKREDISFVQICEYSKDSKIARARDMFYHSQVHYLLYSERFHFFRRPRIKGIRHIVFYQLPNQPHFYSEMCNLMQEANQNPHAGSESNMTVTVLFTKFDAAQLTAIVGTDRATRMITSDQNVHMFMTGD